MNKTVSGILVLIVITVLPVLIVFYSKSHNKFAQTAAPKVMWPNGVNAQGDSTYFQLPIFNAQNADGRMISTSNMDGNISVVEVFFTTCQSICPIMNKQMERVSESLGNNENFRIFSYTVDPEVDDLNKLKLYAKAHDADLNNWYFLRAPQDSLFEFGRWSLKLPMDKSDIEGQFLHSERFVLVDWDRHIRGYYDGTDSVSVNKMMNDIVLLMSLKDKMDKDKSK